MIREKVHQNLIEYVLTYQWSDDIAKEEKQNLIQTTCQSRLSNQEFPLETRCLIATFISSLFKTDLAILYLIYSELAFAFDSEMHPLHHGCRYVTDPTKADTDDEGLSNYEEICLYGTDPTNANTDGDLLTDYKEELTTRNR